MITDSSLIYFILGISLSEHLQEQVYTLRPILQIICASSNDCYIVVNKGRRLP